MLDASWAEGFTLNVVTVSTILDTPANVRRFVNSNLAAGVDHMVIFLDADLPDVCAELAEESRVSVVVTDDSYWKGERPSALNARQKVNANLARVAVLTATPDVWLFHIDGDECLDASQEALGTLSSDTNVVTLEVREAVSSSDESNLGWYKRLLQGDELALLYALGRIDRPQNASYFRGYTSGKSGMRPSLDLIFRTHDVVDLSGAVVEGHRDPSLGVLHNDSVSLDDFVAKWTRHLGTTATYRPAREVVRDAVGAVLRNDVVDRATAVHLLEEIYRRRIEDPVELLRSLGYLELRRQSGDAQGQPDPGRSVRIRLEKVLGVLAREGVKVFRPKGSPDAQGRRMRAAAVAPGLDSDLASRLGRLADAAGRHHQSDLDN